MSSGPIAISAPSRTIFAPGQICRGCGSRFDHWRKKAYCDPTCRPRRQRKRLAKIQICSICDKQFHPFTDTQQACGAACARKLVAAHCTVGEHASQSESACKMCAKLFLTPARKTRRHHFCSPFCRERARNRKRHDYLRAAQRIRLSRIKAAQVEKIDPVVVFERDNWTCQICITGVDRATRDSHDPRYPTIDHIIPISQGGAHTYANVRCAHLGCNASRNTRPSSRAGYSPKAREDSPLPRLWRPREELQERHCDCCGSTFTQKSTRQKYCGPACVATVQAFKETLKRSAGFLGDKECIDCGLRFACAPLGRPRSRCYACAPTTILSSRGVWGRQNLPAKAI